MAVASMAKRAGWPPHASVRCVAGAGRAQAAGRTRKSRADPSPPTPPSRCASGGRRPRWATAAALTLTREREPASAVCIATYAAGEVERGGHRRPGHLDGRLVVSASRPSHCRGCGLASDDGVMAGPPCPHARRVGAVEKSSYPNQ